MKWLMAAALALIASGCQSEPFGASPSATSLADEPVFAFNTATSAEVTADCAVGRLRGQHLGINIFTLNPQMSRVFDGYLITMGDVRITVQPDDSGSNLRLYSSKFVNEFMARLEACRVPREAGS